MVQRLAPPQVAHLEACSPVTSVYLISRILLLALLPRRRRQPHAPVCGVWRHQARAGAAGQEPAGAHCRTRLAWPLLQFIAEYAWPGRCFSSLPVLGDVCLAMAPQLPNALLQTAAAAAAPACPHPNAHLRLNNLQLTHLTRRAVGAARRGPEEDWRAQSVTWNGHHGPAHGGHQHAGCQVSERVWRWSGLFFSGLAQLHQQACSWTNTPVAK